MIGVSKTFLGKVEQGRWIDQLSLHLGAPASCNYVDSGFDRVVFLTMERQMYDETIGKFYMKELFKAVSFLA